MSDEPQKNDKTVESAKSKYDQMMENHPILYDNRKLPMTQTCMCWGIECGEGWYFPLADLSDILEGINQTFGKQYHFAIKAEQVKEKYGTLRFYYQIVPVYPLWRRILAAPWNWLAGTSIRAIRPVGFDEAKRISWAPKFTYWLYRGFFAISSFFLGGGKDTTTILSFVDRIVSYLINETEKKCFDTCEDCGMSIGENWSPRCETTGWITYICEKCAKEKRNGPYIVVMTPQEKSFYAARGARMDKELLKRDGRVYQKGEDITERWMEERRKREEEWKRADAEAEKNSDEKAKSAKPKNQAKKGKKNAKDSKKGN